MSALALALHQFRYDQKIFWRNPAAVFFTVMFPVMFLVIFGVIVNGRRSTRSGGIDATTYYVPAIITLAVVSATMVNLAMHLTIDARGRDAEARPRDAAAGVGVLRRDGSATPSSSPADVRRW